MDVDAKFFFGFFEDRDHDFGSVVDGKDDVFDSGFDESFDLVKAAVRGDLRAQRAGSSLRANGGVELTSLPVVSGIAEGGAYLVAELDQGFGP